MLDLSGLSPLGMLAHMRSPQTQAEFAHSMDYAPESLCRVLVVNAPFGAGAVWRFACLFLPPRTRAKFVVMGGGYGGQLRALLDPAQMPSCYGGDVPREWPPLEDMAGLDYPWVDEEAERGEG